MATVRIHRGERGYALLTDADTEADFWAAFWAAVTPLMGGGDTDYEPKAALDMFWACRRELVSMCCALRGHRSNVTKYRGILIAGESPTSVVLYEFDCELEAAR